MRQTLKTLERKEIDELKSKYKIKEYIFIVEKDVYRVYGECEETAIETFKETCRVYSKSRRVTYREYWEKLLGSVEKGCIEIIENTDFMGVRRIK